MSCLSPFVMGMKMLFFGDFCSFFFFPLRTFVCFSGLQVVPGHNVFVSVELLQAMIVTCCGSPCVRSTLPSVSGSPCFLCCVRL